jgi:arylsulfatase A-like enzyme
VATKPRSGLLLRGAATAALVAWTALPIAAGGNPGAPAAVTKGRPNILLIVSDDQTWSTFDRTLNPSVYSEIVDKGALFTRAYVGTSLCCPSRSEILTGLHEHHTGVDSNFVTLTAPTIVQALHDLGYATILSGKYLNSWPCRPRPEFDRWVCQYGQGGLVDPTLIVDGTQKQFTGYAPAIQARFVTNFIAQTPSTKPFFAMYTPKSPHLPADDPRYDSMTVDPLRGPAFDQETRNGKLPQYMQRNPLSPGAIANIDTNHMNMAQSVRALDDDVSSILASLGSRAENTLVFYTSDNGYLYGDHRRSEKQAPYEESVRVPLAVRWPRFLPESKAFSTDALVQNVDIAPTIADAVGIHWGADGTSLIPILRNPVTTIRTGALIQHCEGVGYPCYLAGALPSFQGIVTQQYAYIEYVTNERELYDLVTDPAELTNLAGDPAYAQTKARLSTKLAALRAPPEPDTTIVTGTGAAKGRSRVPTFTYFSQSRLAHFACRLTTNGVPGTWGVCDDQPAVVGPLADGDYTFEVQATDERRLTDPTPDSRSFSIHTAGPEVQILSGPPPFAAGSSASFEFHSEQAVSYQCALAPVGMTQPWMACSAPSTTYDNLADGLYAFQVRARDATGAITRPAAGWLFGIENDGPDVVLFTTPPASSRDTSALFEFRAIQPVSGMTCAVDLDVPADCSIGSFTATGLTEGTHTLHVWATDLLGFTSETTFDWDVDLSPPTLTVDDQPPEFTNVSQAQFAFSQGEGGTFHCKLDQDPAIVCPSTTAFFALAEGQHKLLVSAFDRAGNESPETQVTWTQDTIAPTVTILAGPDNETSATSATFRFKGNEGGVTFTCSVDGAEATACTSPLVLLGLAEGPHAFSVSATDRVGNVGPAADWAWTVDLTAPLATITSGPADPTAETTATFEFSSDDPAATYSCALDGASPAACSSPAIYESLAEGPHTFSVSATDGVGNIGPVADWAWTITGIWQGVYRPPPW